MQSGEENRDIALHLCLARRAGEGLVSGWRTKSLEEIASSGLPTCGAEATDSPVAIVWQNGAVSSWVVVYQRNQAFWFNMGASTNHGRASAQVALEHSGKLRDDEKFASEFYRPYQDVPLEARLYLEPAYETVVNQVFRTDFGRRSTH